MVTAAEMKEIERRAAESGLSYDAMMDNAGRAAAGVLFERVPALRTLAVFCGRGNNGGDGFVVAREAAARGAEVLVVLTDGEPSTDCARHAFDAMGLPAKLLAELSDAEFAFVKGADAVADAVIGLSLIHILADNGEGIPPARRAHIFEPFVMGDDARSSPGSGLGLSITRRIVERHGGTVELAARTAPGRTTEFVITLPLANGAE